jgi:hypothetical protein
LREGSLIYVQDNQAVLRGEKTARIFKRGSAPLEVMTGTDLNNVFF